MNNPYDLQLRSQIRFSIRSSAGTFECGLEKIFKRSIQNLPSSTFETVFALLWFSFSIPELYPFAHDSKPSGSGVENVWFCAKKTFRHAHWTEDVLN